MVTLYDITRLTGIFTGIGWALEEGRLDEVSAWIAGLAAAAVGISAAWVATRATARIARTQSEPFLWLAYAGTFGSICVAGAIAGVACQRLLHSN